jgi:hypothetical protein
MFLQNVRSLTTWLYIPVTGNIHNYRSGNLKLNLYFYGFLKAALSISFYVRSDCDTEDNNDPPTSNLVHIMP